MTGNHDHTHSHHAHDDDEMQRWKHDGVRVIPGDQLDPNVPSTPGMDRKAAINFARAGAQKLWAGTVTIKPGLAFCARTMLPAWALDGGGAFFLTNVVCSSGNSPASSQAARTGD